MRTPLLLTFLLPYLSLLPIVIPRIQAESDPLRTRDFQSLSSEDVQSLIHSDPSEWQSTDTGHLAKLLIPRPGEHFH